MGAIVEVRAVGCQSLLDSSVGNGAEDMIELLVRSRDPLEGPDDTLCCKSDNCQHHQHRHSSEAYVDFEADDGDGLDLDKILERSCSVTSNSGGSSGGSSNKFEAKEIPHIAGRLGQQGTVVWNNRTLRVLVSSSRGFVFFDTSVTRRSSKGAAPQMLGDLRVALSTLGPDWEQKWIDTKIDHH